MADTAAAFDWNASDYERHSSAQKRWAVELLEKLTLRDHEQVLDLGCGDGRITAEIAQRVPNGLATGVDSSTAMIAHARDTFGRGKVPNLRLARADARALPFSEAFDVVFSNAVLHWVKDHRAVLRGLSRSLRPGGRVLMQMGGRGNAAGILEIAEPLFHSLRWQWYFEGFVSPYAFYGPEEYRGWLAEAGLTPARLELIPKDMLHAGQAGLEGWIRTTWQPYTSRLPEGERPDFIAEVAGRYLEHHPLDGDGQAHVEMVRLEVEAQKA